MPSLFFHSFLKHGYARAVAIRWGYTEIISLFHECNESVARGSVANTHTRKWQKRRVESVSALGECRVRAVLRCNEKEVGGGAAGRRYYSGQIAASASSNRWARESIRLRVDSTSRVDQYKSGAVRTPVSVRCHPMRRVVYVCCTSLRSNRLEYKTRICLRRGPGVSTFNFTSECAALIRSCNATDFWRQSYSPVE